MECVPVCRTCTGICQIPVQRPESKARTRKKPVAPERLAGYIVLVCGAYTTMEEQIATPGFRKSRRRYWCEKHGHWANPYTLTERIAAMEEKPLF